jgi:TP901 family phage tail tape measure protein
MALTSRDVMFVLRAQDFASRGVRNLGASFTRLGRELEAVNRVMQSGIARSQDNMNRQITASQRATQASTHALNDHTKALRIQNNELVAQNRKYTQSQNISATQRQINQQKLKDAQSILGAHNKETQALQRRLVYGNKEFEHNYALRKQIQQNVVARQAHAKTLENDVKHYQNVVNGHKGYIASSKNLIKANQERIDQNNILMARNDREVAQIRRNAEVAQQAARDRARIEQESIRREAEIHQRRIQMQQRQIAMVQAAGAAMMMMGALLTALGSKGIQAFSGLIRESMEFERQMARALTQVDAQVHGTGASIDRLRSIAHDVGRSVPAEMETIGDTLFFIFSSTNATLDQSRDLLRGFAREAVAGSSSIEDAARSSIAILNGMNMEFSDLTRVQDFQFQTVRKGVITYEQLAANIGKLIPSLSRMGQEIEIGGAMLAFLTRNGLSAEMATTAAARSLELMADPRVVRRLENMGFTVRDASGEFLGLDEILGQLAATWGDLPAPERAQKMLDVFGGAGYRIQARRFFDVVLPNFEEFKQHVQWQVGNAGALDRAYNIMFATPANKAQLFKNQVTVLRQELGQHFMAVIVSLIERGSQLITWFSELEESTKRNIVQWGAMAAVGVTVAGVIIALAGALTMITALVRMFTGGWLTAIAVTTGVPAVLTAIIAVLAYLAFNVESVSDSWQKFTGWLRSTDGQATLTMAAIAGLSIVALNMSKIVSNLATLTYGLALRLVQAKTAAQALITTLTVKHPLLLALTVAIGALVVGYRYFNREARQARELTKSYTEVLRPHIDAIISTKEGFDNYARTLSRVHREQLVTQINEAGIADALEATAAAINKRPHDLLQNMVGENKVRQETLDLLHEERNRLMSRAGGVDENSSAVDRYRGRVSSLNPVERERLAALNRMIPLLQAHSTAVDDSTEALRAEMRQHSATGAAIATFIGIKDKQGMAYNRMRENLRAEIYEMIEAEGGIENVDAATLEWLDSAELLNDELELSAIRIQVFADTARGLSSVMDGMTSLTNAWTKALADANEGREEQLTSLSELSNGLDLWIDKLEEGHTTNRSMWGDMARLVRTHGDAMGGDLNVVTAQILAMGDAGPEAMRMLADASPEDFLRVLEVIRIHAAMTSEAFQENIDVILEGFNRLATEFPNVAEEVLTTVFEQVTLAVAKYPDVAEEVAIEMMAAIERGLESGIEPTAAQLDLLGEILAIKARHGGAVSAHSLAEALEIGLHEVLLIGEIFGIDFATVINEGIEGNLDVYNRIHEHMRGIGALADAQGTELGRTYADRANKETGSELAVSSRVRDHLINTARIADEQGMGSGRGFAQNMNEEAKKFLDITGGVETHLLTARARVADAQGTEYGRNFSEKMNIEAERQNDLANRVRRHLVVNRARVADRQGTEYGRNFSERMTEEADSQNNVANRVSIKLGTNAPLMTVNGTRWGRLLAEALNNNGELRTNAHSLISRKLTGGSNLLTAVGTLFGFNLGSSTNTRAEQVASATSIVTKLRGFADTIAGVGTTWGQRIAAAFNSAAQANVRAPTMPAAGGGGGGSVTRNRGGLIPGRGPNIDSVWAYLTRGEYVLRRGVVDRVGVDTLNRLNATGDLRGLLAAYNRGGYVRTSPVPTSGGSTYNSSSETKNEYNYMPGATLVVEDKTDVEISVKDFELWLRRFDA